MELTASSIKPVKGLHAFMPNRPQLHNVIADEVVKAGDIVKQNASQTDALCVHVQKAGVTDAVIGVVVFDSRVTENAVGSKVAIAQAGDVVYMEANGAIVAGAKLQFTADMLVDDTTTDGNTVIGIARTPATAKGDLIQVELV